MKYLFNYTKINAYVKYYVTKDYQKQATSLCI